MLAAADWGTTFLSLGVGVVVALCACIPAVARSVERVMDGLREPSRKVRAIIACVLFVGAARYFLFSAEHAGRPLIPVFHDEYMYLLQARMLSVGRLWMPQHPLADFFDSFYVIVRPVYAVPYFPGTALFYVPGTWLHAAPWATATLIGGLIVAMTYLVLSDWLDGAAGLLGAVMLIATEQMRGLAVMTMSHAALVLLVLSAWWGWSRWRQRGGPWWAAFVGAAAGWAMVTRPLDALCFVLPAIVGMGWDGLRVRHFNRGRVARSACAAVAAALPFAALQLTLNHGLTGRWFGPPITQYVHANFPGVTFGFGPGLVPPACQGSLPQVRDYYDGFFRGLVAEHRAKGFWRTWWRDGVVPAADVCLPNRLLWALVPLGLLRVREPRRAAIVAYAVLFLGASAFYPLHFRHYLFVISPAMLMLALLGLEVIASWCRPWAARAAPALWVGAMALCLCSLPEALGARDHFHEAPYLLDADAKLSSLDQTPAVVLFRYEKGRTDVDEEPVYNLEAAWPDDANVIRAQDRGADDVRIFKYYAEHGPPRFFYRYDRATTELTPLGWASELAAK